MDRRGFLGGALAALAAPAIVSCANIMPVRALPITGPRFTLYDSARKVIKVLPAKITLQLRDAAKVDDVVFAPSGYTYVRHVEFTLNDKDGIMFAPYSAFGGFTMVAGDTLTLHGFSIV